MRSALIKLALCVGAAAAPVASHAAWMWLSLDGTTTLGANHADITDLNTFRLKDASGMTDFSLGLGAQIHDPGTQLFSFTNRTGKALNDFHLTLRCTDRDPTRCNGGQVLGGGNNKSTSNLFAMLDVIDPPSVTANADGSSTWQWLLDFAGGNVLDGQSFAIFDATTSGFANFSAAQFTVDARASVPEPGSASLVALILAGAAAVSSARRQRRA